MVTAPMHTRPRLRCSAYRICSIVLVVSALQALGTNRVLAESAPISPHHAAWLDHLHHPTQPALIGPGGQPQPLSSHARRAAQTQRAVFGFLAGVTVLAVIAYLPLGDARPSAGFAMDEPSSAVPDHDKGR